MDHREQIALIRHLELLQLIKKRTSGTNANYRTGTTIRMDRAGQSNGSHNIDTRIGV